MRTLVTIGAFGTLFVLAGCGQAANAPAETTPLREVAIPEGFTFQATRTVGLNVSVADDVFQDRIDAPVQITKPNGATLFRGVVKKGVDLDVQIPVATYIDHLDVIVKGVDGDRRTRIELTSRRAVGRVE